MPIPTLITDLSTTAASNYPAGSDSPSVLDDVQRAHASFIAKLRDESAKTVDLAASSGSSLVGFIQSGAGAVATTVQDKLRESVSVKDDGAVGDGVTGDAAAFALTEASSTQTFVLPDGLYVSGLAVATKNYEGNGAIQLSSGRNVPGKISEQLLPRYLDPMHKANAQSNGTPRNLVFIGDSITYGYGVTEAQSYSAVVAALLNQNGPTIGCDKSIGASTLLRATQAGSVTSGTNGPVKNSLILAVGASLTFSVTNSDLFGVWFQQSVGAGTITVSVNGSNVLVQSCAGVAANDIFAFGIFKRTTGPVTVVMTASVAPVELTGAYFSHTLATGQLNLMTQAQSGYSTADFTTGAVLTSIGVQTQYNGYAYPIYVVALGTNDIYNPGKAVSSTTFKANLDTICQGLRTYGIPVLTVPLRAVQTTYSPVLESFENYRNAVYEVARKYGYFVIDLSKHDLGSTGGYQADGLHPNSIGHQLLASIYFQELELASVAPVIQSGTLALSGAYTAFGSTYTVPAWDITPGGLVSLCGLVSTNASAKNTVLTTLPLAARPAAARLFACAGLNGAAGATAYVQVNNDGAVSMFDYSSAALTLLSLEGITFQTQR